MYEFKMPSLGADMEAGTLVEWKVRPGDAVERGQVIAVVETQKGAIDVEVWESGVVERFLVEPGATVPVGMALALLRTGEEEAVVPTEIAKTKTVSEASANAPRGAPQEVRPRVSPAARKRAEELGLDIRALPPGQPGAVITREDVERAARLATAPVGEEATGEPRPQDWRDQMRRAIAAAMSKSKREIPHYYLATNVDMTRTLAWLGEQNAKRSVAQRLLPVVPLMKAVALALREVPALNGAWTEGAFKPSPAVHLGMAISMRGGGLVAPAIHNVDVKSIDALMASLRDLVDRVRGGRLRSSELTDATVTLTNLGELGVERVYGIIYPPQVALIGLGRITLRPWVDDGTLVTRQIITATLAADHRASDGHVGALFLSALDRLLQEPKRLESAP